MDTEGLTVNRKTVATALLLPLPALASILSHRAWLMTLAPGVYTFGLGAYFIYLARRTHFVIGVVGVAFMLGAVLLMGRPALGLYPH